VSIYPAANLWFARWFTMYDFGDDGSLLDVLTVRYVGGKLSLLLFSFSFRLK
jgi:hypothetical protein